MAILLAPNAALYSWYNIFVMKHKREEELYW